jgi:lipoprotein signal peptidase
MHRILIRSLASTSAATAVVVADQIAKATVAHADTGNLQVAHNPGFLTGWSPVSAAAVIGNTGRVLATFLASIGRWAVQIGVPAMIPALIAGGMAAHLLDRIRYGAVRDFLPAGGLIIDVADLAVMTGIMLLAASFAWRVLQVRRAGQVITFELPTLRARVAERPS